MCAVVATSRPTPRAPAEVSPGRKRAREIALSVLESGAGVIRHIGLADERLALKQAAEFVGRYVQPLGLTYHEAHLSLLDALGREPSTRERLTVQLCLHRGGTDPVDLAAIVDRLDRPSIRPPSSS